MINSVKSSTELEENYDCLTMLVKCFQEIILMGDYNIDLLQVDISLTVNDFTEIMASHRFIPTIFNPTRITCDSAILIDNIFSNTDFKLKNLDPNPNPNPLDLGCVDRNY